MRRPVAAPSMALAASLVLIPAAASAQQGLLEGLTAILDAAVSSVVTTTTDASGTVARTTTGSVLPRLTLNADVRLFENLKLSTGGVFDVDLSSSTIDAVGIDTTLTRLRPFIELRSVNPVFAPGFGYYRRSDRTRLGDLPETTFVSEDYAAYLGWRPEGLPVLDFQLIRTNTFDGDRAFQDTTKDFGSAIARYASRGLNVSYLGSYVGTVDRTNAIESRQWLNSARVDHGTTFFDKRLHWNTTYNVNHQDLTTQSGGNGGEVAFPVIPFAGLWLLSDTPTRATLSPAPLLVDANLTASAGIDLGVPALGTESQAARNIGLDFQNPSEVNRLLVWVDRELPAAISSSFSWEIYTSSDNLTWTRQTTVSAAPFGPFLNRFQVDFRSVTARYIKVVTRPLSAALPDASRFPDIFVTEVQAFLTGSAAEAPRTAARTAQVLDTNVRMRILDAPALYYEGSYSYTGASRIPYRDTLSNGASLNHTFGRMFAVYGRGAFEQGHEVRGYRVASVGNATFTVNPIRTFRSSILYSGQNEEIGGRPNDRQNVIVQTNAQVYRGVDVLFGFGWNFLTMETGEQLRERLLNVSATIVPRQSLSLTFNYIDTATRSSTVSGIPNYRTRRGYATIMFDPLRTLHLVLAEEVIAVTNEKTRVTHNVGANWVPFPDGALQFNIAYNEALRDLVFGRERSFTQSVRWTFSRQSYIEFAHQDIESKYVFGRTKSKILGVNLRLFL